MTSFLDYPYNKSHEQTHTDVTQAALRSNQEFLAKRLQQLDDEAYEVRQALWKIDQLIQDSGS